MLEPSPADAVSKRVMHFCVTASRYDWPEAHFPFRQTAIHYCPITSCYSSRVTKFSPLVTFSSETTE